MAVPSIRGVVESAIQRASSATGVDFGFLIGTAKRESGYNPRAKAPTSSAAGLFQFVEQTWLSTLKQHGAKYGYARYAALIERGADGRYRVQGDEARKAVMDLRLDAHAASLMAGELASGNAAYIKGRVGRTPSGGELYAAHFLGPEGSARLIQARESTPSATAASMFPGAAAANRSIFYREGRPVTVAELYSNLTATGGGGSATTVMRGDGAQDFLQYASARRSTARLETEASLVDFVLRGSQRGGEGGGGLAGSLLSAEMLRVLSDARDRAPERPAAPRSPSLRGSVD